MSERCERMSEQTSEWPSTYVSILVCSRPQWRGARVLPLRRRLHERSQYLFLSLFRQHPFLATDIICTFHLLHSLLQSYHFPLSLLCNNLVPFHCHLPFLSFPYHLSLLSFQCHLLFHSCHCHLPFLSFHCHLSLLCNNLVSFHCHLPFLSCHCPLSRLSFQCDLPLPSCHCHLPFLSFHYHLTFLFLCPDH